MGIIQKIKQRWQAKRRIKARRLTQRTDPKRVEHIQKLTKRLEEIVRRNTTGQPCIDIRIQDTVRLDKFLSSLDPKKNRAQIERLQELIHYNLVRYGLHQQMNRFGNRMNFKGASVPGPDKPEVEWLYLKYGIREYMRDFERGDLHKKK